jgi:kumamolisin
MNQSHVVLPGTNRVPLPGARVVGSCSEDEWIEVTVKLCRKAKLPELDGRPKEPMTYEELTRTYGCNQEDINKVAEVLHEFGLEVVESDPKTRTVKVAGPASAMEKAFLVKLVHYKHERGDYRGRVGALHVPAKLAGLVEGVFGLDNRRVTKHRSAATAPRMKALSAATSAKARPWFFPEELARIYRFPQGDGSGQAIALLEFGGGYFPSDLAAFCKAAKVSVATVVPISVDHAPTDQQDGAEGEVMLDIEVVAGACPRATIPVYFSQFTEKGWVDVLDAAIHDQEHKPTVISISWGNAEDNATTWTNQAITQINEALKEAALLGITVCVASGDDGSDDQVGDGHAHADFPGSSPYVLGVGGTTLRKNGQTYDETVWKDGTGLRNNAGDGSTGGGVSSIFDRPKWQKTKISNVNPGAKDGRVTPDVAANASGHTGYMTVVDGRTSVTGGTSAAAPLWAALIARINENLPKGKRVGYLTPVLYQASGNSTVGALSCHDIVSGNNITAAVGGYSAGRGFDAVSGWGTPLGDKLLQELKKIV